MKSKNNVNADMQNEMVCLNRCNSYDVQRLIAIVEAQLAALGADDEIKPGMQVVIKPNLVIRAKPETAIITHPALVAAVGSCVKRRGAQVLIAESPGGQYTPSAMKGIFKSCGYTEMAQEYGFSLYTDCEVQKISLPRAKICHNLSVVKPFLDADYIINIAKLKTHGMMGFSGAVKNLFGVVPGLQKPELHCRFPNKTDFADMLLDLCDFISPQLSFIDGIDAMEGNGPTGGTRHFVGAVLAAKNPYVLDLAALQLIGLKAAEIWTVGQSLERGWVKKPDNLEITGNSIEELRVTNFKPAKSSSIDFIDRMPKVLRPLLTRALTPTPKIQKKTCIGCGKCAESCPQHVIQLAAGKAEIQPKGCIRCFCCHEMCPLHVIDIKRLGVFNI